MQWPGLLTEPKLAASPRGESAIKGPADSLVSGGPTLAPSTVPGSWPIQAPKGPSQLDQQTETLPPILNSPPPNPTPEQQKQLDAALALAKDKLSYGLLDWRISDADAHSGLGALKGLPPELKGLAMSKLDPTSFSWLLSEVPEAERTQFKDLLVGCRAVASTPPKCLVASSSFAATHAALAQ